MSKIKAAKDMGGDREREGERERKRDRYGVRKCV